MVANSFRVCSDEAYDMLPPKKKVLYKAVELWHKFPNTTYILKAVAWL